MVNYAGLKEPFSDYANARYVVIPVPYEKTTSYGRGTEMGPRAIVDASCNMELYDEELCKNVAEKGIATLEPLLVQEGPEVLAQKLREICAMVLEDNKFPVVLGGEHSISLGLLLALKDKYKDVSVLHFDAHADLKDEFQGMKYSHGTVMRRISEHAPLVQVGIRSLSDEEADFIKEGKTHVFYAHDMHDRDCSDEIVGLLSEKVFISFDLDVFDPSIMPSTGTPEPGGLFWYDALRILRKVCEKKDVVGFDLVELAPIPLSKAPDFTAAKLVYKVIGYLDKA